MLTTSSSGNTSIAQVQRDGASRQRTPLIDPKSPMIDLQRIGLWIWRK
jgi:hypothetical protein